MDNKMADMKLSKAEKKANTTYPAPASSGPDYPWGLQINLDDAALKKLGIAELPDAETDCQIMAVGKVTRVSSTSEGGKTRRSMEIQIVSMNVACEDSDDKKMSKVWAGYKKGKK